MNYTIALCDDESIQLDIIQGYICRCLGNIDDNYNFILAYSGEELLHKVKDKKVDIFFLDIEMDGINGLDTGRKLRELYENAVIVFITGFKDYALNAFEIRAFNYIIKPLTYEKFQSLFEAVLRRVSEIRYCDEIEHMLTIKTKESTHKIRYSDIYYFEKCLRKIRVICKNNIIEYYDSFKSLKVELDMDYFTQCHQSFIVNNSSIYSYKGQEIFIKDMEQYIPVSKAYVKDVKETLSNELFK